MLLEGTAGFRFEQNLVTKCDGNGLFLSNFNRNASISGNEFSWIGDNAMSAFGPSSPSTLSICAALALLTPLVKTRVTLSRW